MTQPPFVKAKNLAALPDITHGFFGRGNGIDDKGDFNTSETLGDDLSKNAGNRHIALSALGMADVPLAALSQIHSASAIQIHSPVETADRPKADGLVTDQPNIALAIITADCAPILLADPEAGVIGACHAGWKGAINGVIANTIEQMVQLGATPEHIVAAIGPTISGNNYQVGSEFAQQLRAIDSAADPFLFRPTGADEEHFDLPGFVSAQLHRAGITQVEDLAVCPYQDSAQYFSHRHTTHHATQAGRQISIIAQI